MSSETEKLEPDRPVIVWFRDDLRVLDHPALDFAAGTGCPVLAIYILDEGEHNSRPYGAAQKWFLHHGLVGLQTKLEAIGGRLDVFQGSSETAIHDLIKECDGQMVCWNRRYGGEEVKLDTAIKAALNENGVQTKSFLGNLIHEPYRLKTGSGGPYKVYSPFWRALEAKAPPRMPLPAPKKITVAEQVARTCTLEQLNLLPKNPNWAKDWDALWQADEDGAQATFERFLDHGIHGYDGGRDFPDRENVSRLSPYLRFGMISPYQIWSVVTSRRDANDVKDSDATKFLKEIAWREFSYHLLFHYPDLGTKNHQEKFDHFPWRSDIEAPLSAWKKGLTGYPIVDAGMRELWQTGYMHNRVRMVVGSFLVKHLLIDWRHGESWFWDTLVDGDPANNTASWQWIAGSGADAAPYFRVFNPILQGQKFDPDCTYIRRFVPELAKLPNKYLNNPWDAPKEILEKCGVELGKSYPHPIVDHSKARDRALAAFQELKKY